MTTPESSYAVRSIVNSAARAGSSRVRASDAVASRAPIRWRATCRCTPCARSSSYSPLDRSASSLGASRATRVFVISANGSPSASRSRRIVTTGVPSGTSNSSAAEAPASVAVYARRMVSGLRPEAGRRPETILLEYTATEAGASAAELLEVPEGTPVVTIRRLRLADGEPLALMTNTLVARLAPSEDALRSSGLYELLRAQGVHLHVARQRIGARLATASEARTLDEPARAALLTMERTAYDDSGVVIEHGHHIYRASRYIFDTTLVAR